MFQAALAKAQDSSARKARKMAELEKRAKNKFRKTAEDPNRVAKLLAMRNAGQAKPKKKKFLKSSLASNLMRDDKEAARSSSLAMLDKKRRSKKLLYGSSGDEVVYKPGDRVRIGDWLAIHTSYKYNGSEGVIVEKLSDAVGDDVALTNTDVHRKLAKYSVRVPIPKADKTFQTVIESSQYQKVDTEVTIAVNADKIKLIEVDTPISSPSSTDNWKKQIEGYLDEDDLVDPLSGEKARAKVMRRIQMEKEARLTSKKKPSPGMGLNRAQRAERDYKNELAQWREEDTKFHEANESVSTALYLWNENNKQAPAKPDRQKFETMTVRSGTALPNVHAKQGGSKLRKIERREDPQTGGFFTRREFVDYYGDLTAWSRAKKTAIFESA